MDYWSSDDDELVRASKVITCVTTQYDLCVLLLSCDAFVFGTGRVNERFYTLPLSSGWISWLFDCTAFILWTAAMDSDWSSCDDEELIRAEQAVTSSSKMRVCFSYCVKHVWVASYCNIGCWAVQWVFYLCDAMLARSLRQRRVRLSVPFLDHPVYKIVRLFSWDLITALYLFF